MPIIERQAEGNDHVVVFRYVVVSTWLRWLLVGTMLVYVLDPSTQNFYVVATFGIGAIVSAMPYWIASLEIKRRIRSGSVNVSGSKYSLTNPPTFRWTEP